MPHATARADTAGTAKLLVVLLAFAWGFMWIASALALHEVPPWSLRFASSAIGAATLFAGALVAGYDLRLPPGQRLHVMVAGFFNVAAFNMFAVFAQTSGATSRAVIITYSMPIWAALFGRLMLRERLDTTRVVALGLCITGLSVLLWPQVSHGVPISLFLALGCAMSWAFATVYVKWADLTIEPLTSAAWQLLFGAVLITVGMLAFDHYPRLWPLGHVSLLSILYMGIFGVGLAHFLWWTIVKRLSTMTASIGSLLVPVIGVTASAIILGEWPTVADMIGFALIFAAAACVLLQRNIRHEEMPE
jgi:drug/metabolite transporter (DMT)-like permease